MRRTAAIALALSLGAVLAVETTARAAPNDEQVAQSLFETARQLMDRGDYARACPMLAESQRLDPGGGTLLNLAICHEDEGKTATAYFELQTALTQAVKDGRKDREDVARSRISALAPKLARLVIHVPPPIPEGFAILIDGQPVTPAILDVPTPYDPGRHTVQVSATGYETLRWEGEVAPGFTADATIPMRLVKAAPPPPPETKSGSNNTLRIVLGGGAVAFGVLAIVSLGVSLSSRQTGLDNCIPERSYCKDQDSVSAVDRARTFAWVGMGSVVAAAGLGIAALAIRSKTSTTAVTVQPALAGGTLGLSRSF